jgi:transglutaminase-like putative cysteine protease
LALVAGLALVGASTALAGVFVGAGWLGYIALTTAVVAVIGIGLRSLRAGPVVTVLGQLAGLLVLSVVLFSEPGALLHAATVEIHREIAPVVPDPPLLLFCVVTLGLAAILLDVLVLTARMPAAAGLVLASVYAVPALVSDVMLPWWSFAAGAAGFALLLVSTRDTGDGSAASARPSARRAGGIGFTGITTAGVVVALVVAGAAAPIGTVGRFSARGGGAAPGAAPQQIGLRPMTRLRGMLDEDRTPRTLFHVSGLDGHERYLRALTLSRYAAGVGWTKPTVRARGVPVRGGHVLPGGARRSTATTRVRVTPVQWNDRWLPVFGSPRAIRHAGRGYRYNPKTGVIYSRQRHRPPAYVEAALLAQPTASDLRHAGHDFSRVPRKYRELPHISPRIRALTHRLTGSAHTEFSRAKAIWAYFTDGTHGFSYSLSTAPKTSPNALADFLFHGKRGFCEQYASAMAVMLRTIGIPSRVAIGFTPGAAGGSGAPGTRTITSRDAHAWVEVFFPGYGWQTFDPTPLADGRGLTPRYLTAASDAETSPAAGARSGTQRPSREPSGKTNPAQRAPSQTQAVPASGSSPAPLPWWAILVLALALLLGAASGPALVRVRRRRARLRTVRGNRLGAAAAAWQEVADTSTDRGEPDSQYETLRITARRWISAHALDEGGAAGLHVIVEALERSTYAPAGEGTPAPNDLAAALDEVRASLARTAPLRFRDIWLPRSVLRFRRVARPTPAADEREPVG